MKIVLYLLFIIFFFNNSYSNEKYNLPVTEYMCKNHVCPPLYPELTIEDIEYICNVMNSFLEKNIKK